MTLAISNKLFCLMVIHQSRSVWGCFLFLFPHFGKRWKKHVMKSWAHLNELDTLAKPARPFRTSVENTPIKKTYKITLWQHSSSKRAGITYIHIPKSSYFIKGTNQLHPPKQLRLGSQTASWQSQCPRWWTHCHENPRVLVADISCLGKKKSPLNSLPSRNLT